MKLVIFIPIFIILVLLYSITTPFCKIIRKCLDKRITAHAESRGILTPLQFGFQSKLSAQDAILYCLETIQHEIEIGNTCCPT